MQARALTIRLVRLAMAAALLVPLLLFAVGSWFSYRSLNELAEERLIRSVDVQQEQARKAFELIELTFNNANELVSDMSEAEIRRDEENLHAQLKKLSDAVAVVQSIWVYDRTRRPLVTPWTHPPPAQSFLDRDFMQVHLNKDRGTFYGQVYTSVLDAKPFFTVSRRLLNEGAFLGVLELSILPSNFVQFFSTLVYTEGLQYALLRDDAVFLARYPAVPDNVTAKLDERTGFRRTIANEPSGGLYTSISPIDNIERRFYVRRFGETPLYLSAGIATATIREQ